RLKNLPRSASIGVEITGDQPLSVVLVDQKSYQSYPNLGRPALFRGKVINRLSFSVTIPKTDHYYLILDNRIGAEQSTLQVKIQASAQSGSSAPPTVSRLRQDLPENMSENQFQSFGDELKKIFVFEPFPIKAVVCSQEGAFSGPDGIILCSNFIKQVYDTVNSKEKSNDIITFALFHEVAHQLLQQWGYPFYDNEEIADEFASILLIVIGQKERLSSTAEFFLSSPSAGKLVAKIFQDDRHPLSVQRSRNILRCIKNPDKVKRWLHFFVPHLQVPMLRKIRDSQTSDVNRELFEEELEDRKNLD
ncbi:MAG: DUF4344 domain-containing metallopeptidase, partial [Thermodesulfobacteriota bacterium]